MSIIRSPKILLVGAGGMAKEYAKVLKVLEPRFLVIGRGKASAGVFEKDTGIPVVVGGLKTWLKNNSGKAPLIAIVATNEEELGPSVRLLVQHGIKRILVEKPGGMNLSDLIKTEKVALKTGAEIFVAYNRRFYASTRKVQEMIKEDGGVLSFDFEFTEWSHKIANLKKPRLVKNNWFLANSSHVIDLAFFLCGKPKKIKCFATGGLDWHPKASIYSGAGVSENGALFSYHANWESAGRWGVEILTSKRKLILRPLETLFVQNRGSIETKQVFLNDKMDTDFKPGLYIQVKTFLGSKIGLPTIQEQVRNTKYYNLMNKSTDNTN